jgi:hypothetical protein
MRTVPLFALLGSLALASCGTLSSPAQQAPRSADPRLAHATRSDEAGWIALHLEGPSATIGYQYGWLAAPEIDGALAMFRVYTPDASKHDWEFFRRTGRELFWPRLDAEQRAEIEGIAEGARARGKSVDRDDIVAVNGWMEIAWYYLPQLEALDNKAPGNCSAFIATGSYTKDGGIVMGHNAWVDYAVGERWNLVLDIVPEHGHRIFMDSFPGFIHSGDDFALNDAGLMVTETTITGFKGFEPGGVPEFARARRAIQYAGTIDEWAGSMSRESNGAYANSWLIGDTKSGEIARLELGLQNQPLQRTRDGFFVGSNFPCDAKLMAEETTFDAQEPNSSPNARRKRWEELMAEWKGKIDVEAGKRFLADHVDSRTRENLPSGRTLCGHMDQDAEGGPEWDMPSFCPAGAVQAKVTDSKLAQELSFWACMGHACGQDFDAASFLAEHPEFGWEKSILRDMPAGKWTRFRSRSSAAGE